MSFVANVRWEILSFFSGAAAQIYQTQWGRQLSLKIIILSAYDDPPAVDEIMKDGVDGFVLRQRAVVDLIPAVREVCQGGRYMSVSGTVAE